LCWSVCFVLIDYRVLDVAALAGGVVPTGVGAYYKAMLFATS
jgi:hypothetical protein